MYDIIGLVGFKGCGKDTAAAGLIRRQDYTTIAFADPIKDCLSAIFCWDRDMLEGTTPRSRRWRETVDPWWANELGITDFTPRWAMTHFGTDLMRDQFCPKIWIINTNRRLDLRRAQGEKVIIKDCRFSNEIDAIRARRGVIARVRRGPDPAWMSIAREANAGCAVARKTMASFDVHESEWAWIGSEIDFNIDNDGTIVELDREVERLFG